MFVFVGPSGGVWDGDGGNGGDGVGKSLWGFHKYNQKSLFNSVCVVQRENDGDLLIELVSFVNCRITSTY